MTTPLRSRTPAQLARRARKLARRREAGKVPLPVQQPVEVESEKARRARIRARRAEAVRRKYGTDPVHAARVIRMLGLPRTVAKPKKRATRKKAA